LLLIACASRWSHGRAAPHVVSSRRSMVDHLSWLRSSRLYCCLCAAAVPRGPSVAAWREAWYRLIEDNSLSSTATLNGRQVRYGLRLEGGEVQEFCCDATDGTSLQLMASEKLVARYMVTLRANRALRPPAAPKLGELPPHDEQACSMCTGPLRLAARPMVAQAVVPHTGRVWDVHFNISPMEPLGHFLLAGDCTARQPPATAAAADGLRRPDSRGPSVCGRAVRQL